jgi:hypothetical membrane protein
MGNNSYCFQPKTVRACTIGAMIIFPVGLVVAYLLAYFLGGPNSPPGHFSILNDYISDLGGHKFTPAPDLFDAVCIITACLFFVVLVYANKVLADQISAMDNTTSTRIKTLQALRVLGFIGSIVGIAGLIGVGVFSEDRSTIGDVSRIHWDVSAITWVDLAIGSLCLGLLAVMATVLIPKKLGVFMLVGPLTSVVFFAIAQFQQELTMHPLEWVMLACVLWWTFPVGGIILKRTRGGK